MPRRLAEQTNTMRTQFTLNEVAIYFASYRFALIILKKVVLATFKSSWTISSAEDFARSAHVLQAVLRKWEIRKWWKKLKYSFKWLIASRDIPLCLAM